MTWSCGIVGLPNAGKSSLFKALTALDVTIESYPFSTIDPNKAIVQIPDPRLSALAQQLGSEIVTPAVIEITDVAGLVKGASRGEGLGNQFLGHLRNADLLIHVVAGFNSMVNGEIDPKSRIEIVNLELGLADIEVLARRKHKTEPKIKSGDKSAQFEFNLLSKLENHLNQGLPLRLLPFSREEKIILEQLSLLTTKEMIYVYNLSENLFSDPDLAVFPEQSRVVPLCARLEAELSDLSAEERTPFLEAYGLSESQTDKLLQECFDLLNLTTFYTVKGKEARAWIVPGSIRAVEAAGRVHTTMERGFINVEVFAWDRLLAESNITRARENGQSRIEGRDYQVKDGDVLFFRFRD
ncbi:MAG: redox-regulated ATPase YchF [Bacillota bacterium]